MLFWILVKWNLSLVVYQNVEVKEIFSCRIVWFEVKIFTVQGFLNLYVAYNFPSSITFRFFVLAMYIFTLYNIVLFCFLGSKLSVGRSSWSEAS